MFFFFVLSYSCLNGYFSVHIFQCFKWPFIKFFSFIFIEVEEMIVVKWQRFPLLEESLIQEATSDPQAISEIIAKFSERPPLKQGSAYNR